MEGEAGANTEPENSTLSPENRKVLAGAHDIGEMVMSHLDSKSGGSQTTSI